MKRSDGYSYKIGLTRQEQIYLQKLTASELYGNDDEDVLVKALLATIRDAIAKGIIKP